MKSAVTISLVPEARGGPFVYWDDLDASCRAAAGHGFDAVELFLPAADAISPAALRQRLADHGLGLAALGTGAGWVKHKLRLTEPDPTIRRRAREFVCGLIDLAGELGAPAIIGSMQGRFGEAGSSREAALAWLAEELAALGSRAARHGQVLLYEPLNRYETNLFSRAADAAVFLDQHGLASVRLLCDLFHMNIEEADIAGALRAVAARLGHVHFADTNRHAVGFGHLDVAPVAAALLAIGYRGFLSAEVLPLPDSDRAAAQTIASYRRWFGA